MTRPRTLIVLLACAALLPCSRAAKPKPGPDVLVVADASAAIPDEFRPAPGKPVYYLLLGSAERTLGAAIAGEPQPKREELEAEVARVLAAQGFLRTKLGGPMPQLGIVVTWGNANLMIDDFEETDDAGNTSTSSVVYNRREIAQLVGAHQANRQMLSGSEAEDINDAARQDRLYVFVGAFDVQALAKKQKKVMWTTRISIESRRTSLPESLKVMLASAGPYFGKSTEKPVFIDDALRKKAEVHIGEATVVPDAPAAPPAPKK
jgi:hypothetical protein